MSIYIQSQKQELPILILVAAETRTPGLNKQKLPISIFPLCLSAFQVVRCICESGAEMKVAKSPTEIPSPFTWRYLIPKTNGPTPNFSN